MMTVMMRTLLVVVFVVAWSATSQAATAWFEAEVKAAGMSSTGTLFVRLTDASNSKTFVDKWFTGNSTIAKEMLATALTAMTANMRVLINTDPDQPGFPQLNNMYLKR